MREVIVDTNNAYSVPWKPLIRKEVVEALDLKDGTHIIAKEGTKSWVGVVRTDGVSWYVRLLKQFK
jgi:hypothetical protein